MQFHEIQAAPKSMKTILLVVSAVNLAVMLCVFFAFMLPNPHTSITELAIFLPLGLLLPFVILIWLGTGKQYIVVDAEAISIRQNRIMFKPRIILWSDVAEHTVRPFSIFGEFGGWGIRYGFNKKWGYVWSGDHALELKMKNGKKIVLSIVDNTTLEQFLTTIP